MPLPSTFVCAIIKNENGEILINKKRDGKTVKNYSIELPGGKIEDGETPEEAIRRNISEKLGIEIEYPFFIAGYTFSKYSSRGFRDLYGECFECKIIGGLEQKENNEYPKWVSPEDALKIRKATLGLKYFVSYYIQEQKELGEINEKAV